MPNNDSLSFEQSVAGVLGFLHSEKIRYFVLGGVAVVLVGEPRSTLDLDLDLQIRFSRLPSFLRRAEEAGFQFEKRTVSYQARERGTFRMHWGRLPVDAILASTPLEREAFRRSQKTELYGQPIYLPTPEDLLLLKIVPGRPKDLIDAEGIVLRHGKRLDREYLEMWARRLCDEAEDMRIWKILQRLLTGKTPFHT